MARMEKLHEKIGTYKGKTLNGIALLCGLMVLAWTGVAVVMPKYEEGQGLWRQRQQQQLKLPQADSAGNAFPAGLRVTEL